METKYRLKEQARPFVSENLWNKSLKKEQWIGFNISENALEEVSTVKVQVGITEEYQQNGQSRFVKSKTKVSNWSIEEGGKLFFTAHLKNVSFSIFQKFENAENSKKLCEALEQKAQEIVAEITDLK